MKRKLLFIAMTASISLSALLVGCGANEKTNDNPTTLATSSEDNDNSTNVNDSTNEISTTEQTTVEETTEEETTIDPNIGYDVKFYDMPDYQEEYGYTDEETLSKLEAEYTVMKLVFEDMTRKFMNKEEVTADEIKLMALSNVVSTSTTFVCDIKNVIPEDYSEEFYDVVYNREVYTEFAGFDAKSTGAAKTDDGTFFVQLHANYIDEFSVTPIHIGIHAALNEDGSISYKKIEFLYQLLELVSTYED